MESMIRQVSSYLNELSRSVIKKRVTVNGIEICPCGYKSGNGFPSDSEFTPFENGDCWGSGYDSHAWFRFALEVPDDMVESSLELVIETDRNGWDADNPQFLVYVDGVMRQGFDTNHRSLLLGDGKKEYMVYAYGYTGPRVKSVALNAYLQAKNSEVEALYYDISVPFRALDCMEKNTVGYMETLLVLSETVKRVNFLEPRNAEFLSSVTEARKYIKDNFYSKYRGSDISVVCIGHTHIDVAWLWTVGQTREKAQRSFATVIELMKRYPEYKFMSSQAYLYQAVKEEAPNLYEEIKKMIKAGRWEVEGAMWVEADCNLTSGESLVRQILYGKNFFMDEFGVDSRVLWLPDVFGYSAALPQILKKSGVDWFVTSKISWNDMNVMPYDVFSWKGIDGTEVNTYFLTAQHKGRTAHFDKGTTYVASTDPRYIAGSYNRFQQKELFRESMVTFGFGDGGGGPTWEMIETARREKNGLPGIPKADISFAGDMLKRLEKNIDGNPRLPKWQGELYLEFHRGTYTSNAKNKKNNRNCEFLLENAELMSETVNRSPDTSNLHRAWEKMLVDQFHDIIPGSSIREVYEDSDRDYAHIRTVAGRIIDESAKEIASKVKTDKKYIVFNPHSVAGRGFVKADGKTCYAKGIPQKGYAAADLCDSCGVEAGIADGRAIFTNRYYVAEIDLSGALVRLYDRENDREVLRNGGKGNELRIYEDYPDQYDAWEIQEFSGYKYVTPDDAVSAEIVSDGVRRGLRTERHHGGSSIVQTVWFSDCTRRIDFETELDWHSKHRILRTVFPVDINTDRATFEIQFGSTERPTHKNTSWDRMKFETCGHKYVDLSEGNYGVSLLNDCKYGHDIHDGNMALTLLKCPAYPNEVADEGKHFFTYSLLPHSGPLGHETVNEAYMLNYPMYAVPAGNGTGEMPERYSFVSTPDSNVKIETVKKAEKSDDTVIRMYESENKRTNTSVTFGFTAKEIYICDLMENRLEKIGEGTATVCFTIKPFEIITLSVVK